MVRNGKGRPVNTLEQRITLTELWNPPPAGNAHNAAIRADRADRDEHWYGMDESTRLNLPSNGWPEGAERAAAQLCAADVAPVRAGRLVREWDDEDGDDWDRERAEDELPAYSELRRRPTQGHGGRIIDVVVELTASGGDSGDSLSWRTYCAVRICDALESAGYRVAITGVRRAESIWQRGSGGILQRVEIKRPEDTLDLGMVAAALSPAAYRWYLWCWQWAETRNTDGGVGSVEDYEPQPGELLIPKGILDRYAAEEWLRRAAQSVEGANEALAIE